MTLNLRSLAPSCLYGTLGGRLAAKRQKEGHTTTNGLPLAPASRRHARQLRVAAIAAPGVGPRGGVALPPDTASSSSTPKHTGSLFGAVALITGSTVGAGMLALPAVSAPAGILPTSVSLTAIWGLLTLDALLIAEVNLAARAARDSNLASSTAGSEEGGGGTPAQGSGIVTLRQMAEFTLGKAGKGFTVIYLLLAYSLLTAYCTKAAEVLNFFAGGSLPPLAASAAFVGAVGAMLHMGGTRAVDALCQGLTSVLLLLFGVILTAGAAQAGLPASLASGTADWAALEPAVPIMFLALVYHDLVPVIVDYLGGDRQNIRSAIVLGSLVPLAMFVSWEAVALSLLPAGLADSAAAPGAASLLQASLQLSAEGSANAAAAVASEIGSSGLGGGGVASALPAALPASLAALDPLEVFVRRSSPLIGSVVEGFSFLAVMTSFIGTAISLSETLRTEVPPLMRDVCRKLLAASSGSQQGGSQDAELSADLSEDELACLAGGAGAGAGCSAVTWQEDSTDGTTGGGNASSTAEGARSSEGGGSSSSAHSGALGLLALGSLSGEQRGLAMALTLCPPLVMAAANPDSFLGALQLAGGYFMTLLYGILPPVMAWQLRKKVVRSQQQAAAAADAPTDVAAEPEAIDAIPVAAAVARLRQQWPGSKAPSPERQQSLEQLQQPQLAGEDSEAGIPQPWWRQRHEEMVPGGTLVLAGLFSAAMVIEVSRLAADASQLASSSGAGSGYVQGLIEAALLSPSTSEAAISVLTQAAAMLHL